MRHQQIEIEDEKQLENTEARVELLGGIAFKLKRIHGELLDGEQVYGEDLGTLAQAAVMIEADHDSLKRAVESAQYRFAEKRRAAAEKPSPAATRQARKSPTAAAPPAPPATPAKKRGRPPKGNMPPADSAIATQQRLGLERSLQPGTDPHPGDRHRYDPITGRCTVGRLAALGGGECGALTPREKGKAAEAARATPPAAPPKRRMGVQVIDAAGNASAVMSVEEAAANV